MVISCDGRWGPCRGRAGVVPGQKKDEDTMSGNERP